MYHDGRHLGTFPGEDDVEPGERTFIPGQGLWAKSCERVCARNLNAASRYVVSESSAFFIWTGRCCVTLVDRRESDDNVSECTGFYRAFPFNVTGF